MVESSQHQLWQAEILVEVFVGVCRKVDIALALRHGAIEHRQLTSSLPGTTLPADPTW